MKMMIDIEKEALQLNEEQRALLADRLIQSLSRTPPKIKEAWLSELNDRLQAWKNGQILSVDCHQAMAGLDT